MTVSSVPCRQGSCSGGRQCHEHLLSSSQLRKLTQINWILVVKSFGTQNALALWKEMAMSFGFLGLQFSSATAGINVEQPLPPIFLLPPENFLTNVTGTNSGTKDMASPSSTRCKCLDAEPMATAATSKIGPVSTDCCPPKRPQLCKHFGYEHKGPTL